MKKDHLKGSKHGLIIYFNLQITKDAFKFQKALVGASSAVKTNFGKVALIGTKISF